MKYRLVSQPWIDSLEWAEYRDSWQALVNAIMKIWVP